MEVFDLMTLCQDERASLFVNWTKVKVASGVLKSEKKTF